MTQTPSRVPDPVDEGAQARIHGRPKDACPYPAGSEARVAWLEGYDGMPLDEAPASSEG